MLDTTGNHGAHAIYIYGDSDQGNSEGNNNFNTFNNCTVSNNDGYAVIVSDNNSDVTFNMARFPVGSRETICFG